jgi:SnoaL-like polyketide cyclase
MRLGSLDGIIAAQVKNGEGETHMDSKETRAFAQQLMKEVWEPFDSEAVSRFFHRDVVGWHRRADSSWQQLGYDDVVNRLSWDKETNANPIFDVRDIIAEEDRFALRFLYAADFVPTGGKIDVEMMYFYHLRGDKVAEFWLLASVDFDFTAKGTEGTHTR